MTFSQSCLSFAELVGAEGNVRCVGAGGHSHLLRPVGPHTTEVHAPVGICQIVPEEMIIRVNAGTTLSETNDALAAVGLRVSLGSGTGTIGGALAVGVGSLERRLLGPPRDALLQAIYVTASGELAKSGGAVVKNVSGFDLCRLLVGSMGTIGFLAEVILRATPLPAASRWLQRPLEPETSFAAIASTLRSVYRPASVLVSANSMSLLIEGDPHDVQDQHTKLLAAGFRQIDEAPDLPLWRMQVAVGTEVDRAAEWQNANGSAKEAVAIVGTGLVALPTPAPVAPLNPAVRALNTNLRLTYDPTRRLNPGIDVLTALHGATDATVDHAQEGTS